MIKVKDLMVVKLNSIISVEDLDLVFPSQPSTDMYACYELPENKKFFSVWLPGSILELTIQELSSYLALGIVIINPNFLQQSSTLTVFLELLDTKIKESSNE